MSVMTDFEKSAITAIKAVIALEKNCIYTSTCFFHLSQNVYLYHVPTLNEQKWLSTELSVLSFINKR